MTNEMATLTSNEGSLAAADLGGFVTQAQVEAAIGSLNEAVRSAQSQLTAALATAQADVTQAQNYEADAQTLCSSQ